MNRALWMHEQFIAPNAEGVRVFNTWIPMNGTDEQWVERIQSAFHKCIACCLSIDRIAACKSFSRGHRAVNESTENIFENTMRLVKIMRWKLTVKCDQCDMKAQVNLREVKIFAVNESSKLMQVFNSFLSRMCHFLLSRNASQVAICEEIAFRIAEIMLEWIQLLFNNNDLNRSIVEDVDFLLLQLFALLLNSIDQNSWWVVLSEKSDQDVSPWLSIEKLVRFLDVWTRQHQGEDLASLILKSAKKAQEIRAERNKISFKVIWKLVSMLILKQEDIQHLESASDETQFSTQTLHFWPIVHQLIEDETDFDQESVSNLYSQLRRLVMKTGVTAQCVSVIVRLWDLTYRQCFENLSHVLEFDIVLSWILTNDFYEHPFFSAMAFFQVFFLSCKEDKYFRKVFSRISICLPESPLLIEESSTNSIKQTQKLSAYMVLLLIVAQFSPQSDCESLYHFFQQTFTFERSSFGSRKVFLTAWSKLIQILIGRNFNPLKTLTHMNRMLRDLYCTSFSNFEGKPPLSLHKVNLNNCIDSEQIMVIKLAYSHISMLSDPECIRETLSLLALFIESKNEFSSEVILEALVTLKQVIPKLNNLQVSSSIVIRKCVSEILTRLNQFFQKNYSQNDLKDNDINLLNLFVEFIGLTSWPLIECRLKDWKTYINLFGTGSKWKTAQNPLIRAIPLRFFFHVLRSFHSHSSSNSTHFPNVLFSQILKILIHSLFDPSVDDAVYLLYEECCLKNSKIHELSKFFPQNELRITSMNDSRLILVELCKSLQVNFSRYHTNSTFIDLFRQLRSVLQLRSKDSGDIILSGCVTSFDSFVLERLGILFENIPKILWFCNSEGENSFVVLAKFVLDRLRSPLRLKSDNKGSVLAELVLPSLLHGIFHLDCWRDASIAQLLVLSFQYYLLSSQHDLKKIFVKEHTDVVVSSLNTLFFHVLGRLKSIGPKNTNLVHKCSGLLTSFQDICIFFAEKNEWSFFPRIDPFFFIMVDLTVVQRGFGLDFKSILYRSITIFLDFRRQASCYLFGSYPLFTSIVSRDDGNCTNLIVELLCCVLQDDFREILKQETTSDCFASLESLKLDEFYLWGLLQTFEEIVVLSPDNYVLIQQQFDDMIFDASDATVVLVENYTSSNDCWTELLRLVNTLLYLCDSSRYRVMQTLEQIIAVLEKNVPASSAMCKRFYDLYLSGMQGICIPCHKPGESCLL